MNSSSFSIETGVYMYNKPCLHLSISFKPVKVWNLASVNRRDGSNLKPGKR